MSEIESQITDKFQMDVRANGDCGFDIKASGEAIFQMFCTLWHHDSRIGEIALDALTGCKLEMIGAVGLQNENEEILN